MAKDVRVTTDRRIRAQEARSAEIGERLAAFEEELDGLREALGTLEGAEGGTAEKVAEMSRTVAGLKLDIVKAGNDRAADALDIDQLHKDFADLSDEVFDVTEKVISVKSTVERANGLINLALFAILAAFLAGFLLNVLAAVL